MDILLERICSLIPTYHGGVKEFADKIGIAANLISEWKSGRSHSYTKYVDVISDVYGVSADWLLGKTNDDKTSNTKESFWETFSRLCFEKNKSPNAVAAEIGISSGSITAWKTTDRQPSAAILGRIAEYFEVTVEHLLGKTDQKEKAILSDDLSAGVKEIMELAQSMSNAELALLLEKAKKIKGV